MPPSPYKAFFDRSKTTINGRFSIRAADGEYIIRRAAARSGQRGYTQTSWERGRSPVPFGVYNLYTDPNNEGQVAGKTGIGEFFPIDNQGDRRTIKELDVPEPRYRLEIGLHEENGYPGSAGCIVIVNNMDWKLIRDWLKGLKLESIPLEVL